MEDIRTVVSHPQALGQCAPYIRRHGWEQSEAVNTATAAMEVAKNGERSVAVIASYETAELYGLRVLEKRINESGTNTTRFAVFTKNILPPQESDDRFIIFFTVKNTAGALLRAIEAIGQAGFNLKSLKSRPTKEANWDYYFFAEGEGSLATSRGKDMLASLGEVCGSIKILGSFDREKPLNETDDADSELECALSAIED
jgi:chorismate mutase/prephenate dehydratase